MDDWQLLQNYVERDSETAFRTLVNRYVSLVYSVALRQVRDAQLAEEVAQAVFLLLARKARGFRQGVVLSGWLFRTTRFVASRAVRAEQRRQHREQEAFAMQQLTTTDDAWKRISPALDEALEHLGEADRNAVLLRFFNDKSHRETAAALGVSEDAAKKRVARALDKLRNFFAGRGVTLSAAVLASAMAANGAKAATPETTASISAKVIASGSIGAGILPPLVSQTLSAWRWAKLKLAGALASTVAVAVVIGFVLIQGKPNSSPVASGNNQSPPVANDADLPASTTRASRAAQTRRRDRPDLSDAARGVVLQPDGQPAAGAEVAMLTLEHGAWLGQARFAYREKDDMLIVNADADGQFVIGSEPTLRTAHSIVAVSRDGFARVPVRYSVAPLTIHLQPWGRVEGIIDPSARRRPVDAVVLDDRTTLSYQGSLRLDAAAFRLQPGDRNDFNFEFVPPETFCVWLSAGAGIPYPEHHHTWVTVLPGTTTQITITETGFFVKGRLAAIGGEGDWTRQTGIGTEYEDTPMLGIRIPSHRFYASRFAKLSPDVPRPEAPPESTYGDSMQWAAEYWSSEAARGPVRMDAILAVSEDGSFESLEGVQPGNYRLEASVNGKRVQRRITVPIPDEIAASVVNLGDVPVGDKTTPVGPVAPAATGLNQ